MMKIVETELPEARGRLLNSRDFVAGYTDLDHLVASIW